MSTRSFCGRFFLSPILRRAVVLLVVLAWGGVALGSAIHEAAWQGDLEKVKALLKGNSELVFSTDSEGRTPLHHAAFAGHKEVAALLLANKVAVDSKDSHARTALHCATTQGHKDIVELLLANKALVNVRDSERQTPLHKAARYDRRDVADLLLK
jgi:ankyrin repeat protein